MSDPNDIQNDARRSGSDPINQNQIDDDHWRVRYARQIALSNWGESGQARLSTAKVLIVGLGGLGSPVATYLAAAGVGRLVLNDFDRVDLSNLPRQPLHGTQDVGELKTHSAQQSLERINPTVEYSTIDQRLNLEELTAVLDDIDCVVDCSDNFGTRFTINQAAVATNTPLFSSAAIRHEGQVIVFRNDLSDSPCYRCLYEESDEPMENCQGQGVMTPLVGIIGSFAATTALNFLVFGSQEMGRLHCFDASTLNWRSLKLNKDPHCPVCG